MTRKEKREQKARNKSLDRVLSIVSAGMLLTAVILDTLDRRKKPKAVFPEVDPETIREEARTRMQDEYNANAQMPVEESGAAAAGKE